MIGTLALPLALSTALGAAFLSNEFSHGGLSEAMGVGHHHMLDYGSYHCVSHDDSKNGQTHLERMHNSTSASDHPNCPGGPGMHQGDGPGHGMG